MCLRVSPHPAGGRALLMLTPGEAAGMRAALEGAAIPTKPLRMNPGRTQAIGPALQALCSKDAELKVRKVQDPDLLHLAGWVCCAATACVTS
jgi:hypothetical protein